MKKFALSVAALCGLGFAGVNTVSAGDWHGNHYDNHNHVKVVKKYEPVRVTPIYNNKWNDGCFPTPVVRKPVYNTRWDDCYDYRTDYRRPVGPSKGFGFNTP